MLNVEPTSKNTDLNTEKWKSTDTNSNYRHQPVTNLDQGLSHLDDKNVSSWMQDGGLGLVSDR